MRTMKCLGMVVMATVALIAFAGPSSALASKTTLCASNDHNPFCLGTNTYPSGSSLTASSSNMELKLGGLGSAIRCSEPSLSGTTGAESGEPLPASFHWTLSGCNVFWGESDSAPCVAEKEYEPESGYPASVQRSSNGNGTITLSGPEGKVGWLIDCPKYGGLHCRYWFASPTFNVTGGSPAVMPINQEVKHNNGCTGGAGEFSATYTFNSPKPLYLERPGTEQSSGELRLCKVQEQPCKLTEIYPVGTTINAEASDFKIATNWGENITCGNATLSAEVQSLAAPLSVGVQYAFKECLGPVGSSCTATSEESTGTLSYNPKIALTASLKTQAIWDFKCSSPWLTMHCVWNGVGIPGKLTAGEPALLSYDGLELFQVAGGGICPEKSFVTAHYTVTSPKSLYFSTT